MRLDTKIAAMIAITRLRPSSTGIGYTFAFYSSSAWIENTLHRVTPAMKGVIFPCPSAIPACYCSFRGDKLTFNREVPFCLRIPYLTES